ncbi:S-acyl fatty acid synthase thioesterase, medium chain isoform X2 [Zonotrichia leucophrys gambelii]|uniref:S-acyl fatty acid synthase thioesterase, medium chain isoform X2 n=1 Tax=Zonotrichia leucophrys gambelii TaxID=257770 RepID=UPI00314048F7
MEKLVACVQKKPDAVCRLICFPWAGSGTSQLAQWGRLFNDSVEVFCIRLPGRETRLEEPFAKDMTSVVNEITSVLLKELKEKPFAFFGHSFGTYMSFAVALHLKKKYGLEPVHLFMSAAHSPNILGGNFELPHDEDLWRDTALTFKEDAKLFQTCSFEKTEMNIPFSCDITYFCGSDDKIYDAKGWQELTSGDTSFYELPGDHLYLLKPSNESFLIKHMTRSIENGL